jgi:PIN domain nuclease of toxin-antitoxin system
LSAETVVHASVASWWEIAIKTTLGKLDADVAVLHKASEESGFVELPVLGAHIETLARLPVLHRDPFDRLLLSQAISEPMTFLTSDAKLAPYSSLVQLFG